MDIANFYYYNKITCMTLTQTPLLILIDIILYLIIFFSFKNSTNSPFVTSKNKRNTGIVCIVLFCLFSFWGSDWFHYLEAFPEIKAGIHSNLEDIYYYIAQLSPSYIVFRFFIWGTALFLFSKTISNINVSNDLCWFIFGSSYLIWFSYARASLAMSIAFCGFSIINKENNKNKVWYFIFGGALIALSFYLHKSSLFVIICIILTLVAKNNPKFSIIISLLLFPIFIYYLNSNLSDFMLLSFEDDTNDISSYLQKGQMYMSAEGRLRGIGEIIRNILERSPYYLTSVISFWALLKRENQYPSSIKAFFVLQIIIVLMSTAFLFTSKVISMEVIYIRFLRFAFIPTSIVLAFLYENGYKHKYIKTVVGIAILGSVYSLLYSFYSSFSGII